MELFGILVLYFIFAVDFQADHKIEEGINTTSSVVDNSNRGVEYLAPPSMSGEYEIINVDGEWYIVSAGYVAKNSQNYVKDDESNTEEGFIKLPGGSLLDKNF